MKYFVGERGGLRGAGPRVVARRARALALAVAHGHGLERGEAVEGFKACIAPITAGLESPKWYLHCAACVEVVDESLYSSHCVAIVRVCDFS